MRRPRRVSRPSSSSAPRAYLSISDVSALSRAFQSPHWHAQLLHCDNKRVDGGRVHKIEVHNVVDSHRFECQNNVAEIRPLDFGDCGGKHLVFERVFGVQTVALAWSCAAGAPFALVCRDDPRQCRGTPDITQQISFAEKQKSLTRAGLADGRDLQCVHSCSGIVHLVGVRKGLELEKAARMPFA